MPPIANRTTLGIMAGIATGMLWGIVFIVPQILPDFTAVELSLGRYLFFGIASCYALPRTLRDFKSFAGADKWRVLLLSASGFWLYTILLFMAVNAAGGILATLVIGLLPITIPLAAKRSWRVGRRFGFGLALIFTGLLVLELAPLHFGEMPSLTLAGMLPLGACLCLWTWFGIRNTDFVRKYPAAKVSLTNLMGISSFVILAVLAVFMVDMTALLHHPHLGAFLFWSAVIGFGSSWAANILWNICSENCPATISGPLVVAETSFGVLYTFMLQDRLPAPHEAAALALFATGVIIAIRAELRAQIKPLAVAV